MQKFDEAIEHANLVGFFFDINFEIVFRKILAIGILRSFI